PPVISAIVGQISACRPRLRTLFVPGIGVFGETPCFSIAGNEISSPDRSYPSRTGAHIPFIHPSTAGARPFAAGHGLFAGEGRLSQPRLPQAYGPRQWLVQRQ